MGGLKIEKTKECHFISKIFSRRENDMESTFVFHGIKNAQFFSPLEFWSSPPKEVGLTKNPGTLELQFSQPINFNYELPHFLKYIKKLKVHFVAPSHFTLHPNAVKLKGRLFKNEPWPLRGFLHGFSTQV
jgi:hypothetical protein